MLGGLNISWFQIYKGHFIGNITIKTPNPKCRLYWRFIDWRCHVVSLAGISAQLCELLTPPSLQFSSPPPSRVNKYRPISQHCKKSRRTFRCPFEKYLPDVEKTQQQCRIFLFIYLCVICSTLLSNEKVRH